MNFFTSSSASKRRLYKIKVILTDGVKRHFAHFQMSVNKASVGNGNNCHKKPIQKGSSRKYSQHHVPKDFWQSSWFSYQNHRKMKIFSFKILITSTHWIVCSWTFPMTRTCRSDNCRLWINKRTSKSQRETRGNTPLCCQVVPFQRSRTAPNPYQEYLFVSRKLQKWEQINWSSY